jgi:hypothetical protein
MQTPHSQKKTYAYSVLLFFILMSLEQGTFCFYSNVY